MTYLIKDDTGNSRFIVQAEDRDAAIYHLRSYIRNGSNPQVQDTFSMFPSSLPHQWEIVAMKSGQVVPL